MGASAREIEREIKATRERMDDNLTRLEGSAATSARRYGRIAAVGLGALAVAGIALVVYRRTRRPTLKDRLDEVSIDNLRSLLDRLKEEMPSVTLRVNEKSEREQSMLESILRKVGPAIAGTASSVLLERVARPSDTGKRRATPQPE